MVITERMASPLCNASKEASMSASGNEWVANSSTLISFRMYISTRLGTSVRPLKPPNAHPRQTRPVTSWKGRVEISAPPVATPTTQLSPQPLWHDSRAYRMV